MQIQEETIQVGVNSLQDLLKTIWKYDYIKKKQSKQITVSLNQYKVFKRGIFYVVYNPQREQRPIEGLQKQTLTTHKVHLDFKPNQDKKDKHQICWFKSDGQFDILLYLILDSSKIVQIMSKEQAQHAIHVHNKHNHKIMFQGEQIELHQILINKSPLCQLSCVLPLYLDQNLPQLSCSDSTLIKVFKIFLMFPNIKIGFNSLGGGASVNCLHFQLFFTEQMLTSNNTSIHKTQQKIHNLPIELVKSQPFGDVTLRRINQLDQIRKFNVGVHIDFIDNYDNIGQAFVFSTFYKTNFQQMAKSISFVVSLFIDQLILMEIPHNILLAQSGKKVYLMLRQFSDNQAKFGFTQASGVFFGKQSTTVQELIQKKKHLLIDQKRIQSLMKKIKTTILGGTIRCRQCGQYGGSYKIRGESQQYCDDCISRQKYQDE